MSEPFLNDGWREAIATNNVALIHRKIMRGDDINERNIITNQYHLSTPLQFAVIHKNKTIFKMLLAAKADVNIKHEAGWSALHLAVVDNMLLFVHILLKHGADINTVHYYNQTPLYTAVTFDYHDMVRLLLDEGADASIVDKDGKQAIDYAKTDEMKRIFQDYETEKILIRKQHMERDERNE